MSSEGAGPAGGAPGARRGACPRAGSPSAPGRRRRPGDARISGGRPPRPDPGRGAGRRGPALLPRDPRAPPTPTHRRTPSRGRGGRRPRAHPPPQPRPQRPREVARRAFIRQTLHRGAPGPRERSGLSASPSSRPAPFRPGRRERRTPGQVRPTDTPGRGQRSHRSARPPSWRFRLVGLLGLRGAGPSVMGRTRGMEGALPAASCPHVQMGARISDFLREGGSLTFRCSCD